MNAPLKLLFDRNVPVFNYEHKKLRKLKMQLFDFPWVTPPDFAGEPQEFDDSGKMKKPPNSWTAQSQEKGGFMNDIQCLNYTKWECKSPYRVDPEILEKTAL